jgi:uncharacterized protein YecE (DUF72 family)
MTNASLAIVRFHGRNEKSWYSFDRESGSRFEWEYTLEELGEWVPKIERALAEADEVHVFFNTDGGDGQSPRNAKKLMRLFGQPVPDEAPRQSSLF